MIRWNALLLVGLALVGCRVRDVTFTGPGVGDGGTGDGDIDGPPGARASGYIIDLTNTRIKHVSKDATGALTAGLSTIITGPNAPYNSAVVTKSGTYLILFSGDANAGRETTFEIVGAALSEIGTTTLANCPNPTNAVLHPGGNFVAVSCANGVGVAFPIMANGMLGGGQGLMLGGSPFSLAFSPNGNCLFWADRGAGGNQAVILTTFNPNTGALVRVGTVQGPSNPTDIVFHPNGMWAYVVNGLSPAFVQPYLSDGTCSLAPMAQVAAVTANQQQLVIDPTAQYLFSFGPSAHTFGFNADGSLDELFSPVGPTDAMLPQGAIVDPAVPSKVYVTVGAGVFTIPVAQGGMLMQGVLTPGSGTSSRTFVLAP